MCDLLKPISAVEYKGKLYRSEREAAAAAVHDIGVDLYKGGVDTIGKALLASASKLMPLFAIMYPPEKAPVLEPKQDPKPVYPDGGTARGDKATISPYEFRMALYRRLNEMENSDTGEAALAKELMAEAGVIGSDHMRKALNDEEVAALAAKVYAKPEPENSL
jgi:hypothetical protein